MAAGFLIGISSLTSQSFSSIGAQSLAGGDSSKCCTWTVNPNPIAGEQDTKFYCLDANGNVVAPCNNRIYTECESTGGDGDHYCCVKAQGCSNEPEGCAWHEEGNCWKDCGTATVKPKPQ